MNKKLSFALCSLALSLSATAENYYEDALKAFDLNDIETSYVHLKNALQENQDNLPAKILMGQVLLRKGMYEEGIEEFRDALDLRADPNPFVYEMGRALLFNKQFNEVIALAELTGLNKENRINILLLKSNAYSALNKPNEASQALLQALSIEPERLGTITSLASYYLTAREFEESRNYLDKALALAPNNSRVWNLNGEFYNAQGRGDEALKAFKTAYDLDAKDPVVMRSLANQYSAMNYLDEALAFTDKILADAPFDTYTELLKSRLLIRNGQNEQAQVILESISSRLSLLTDVQKSADPSIAYVSGSAAFLQGNYEQAQQDLIYFVNARPDDLSGINMLVEIYQSQRLQDKVEALLERFESRIKNDLYLSLNLYNVYLRNNKTYKAKSLLNELERLYPNNLLIVIAQANYLVSTNRLDGAITLLKKYSPKTFNSSYELNLGNLYLSVPDFENADKIADSLLEYDNQASQNLIFKGVILSKQRQWQESIQYFDKVLNNTPNHFTASYNKATALAALGNITEAKLTLSLLLDKYPNSTNLLIFSAKLKRDSGEIAEAVEILAGILKRKPREIAASELLYEIYFSQGKYDLALIEANRLNNNTFLNVKYLSYMANVHTKLGQFEKANVYIGKLLGLAENAADFYQLALLQISANYYDDALKSLDTAISKDKTQRVYQLEKAKLLLTLKQESKSKSLLDSLAKENAKDANLQYAYGLLSMQKEQFEQAYKMFSEAYQLDKNFTGAIVKMYMLAQQGINTASFINTLEKEITNTPENYFIRNLLADVYLVSNQQDKALAHYLAIEGKPVMSQSSVLNNLANIYATRDTAKALSYIEQAIALENNTPALLDTYGWILSLTDNLPASLETLRKASAIDANDPLINYHLALTLEKMGRIEDAKSELKRAVSSPHQFLEKSAAKALLDKLSQQP